MINSFLICELSGFEQNELFKNSSKVTKEFVDELKEAKKWLKYKKNTWYTTAIHPNHVALVWKGEK